MDRHIQVRRDPDINAVYVQLREGKVHRTEEVEDAVYVDIDADGNPIGIELLHAEDALPFVQKHRERFGIPDTVLNEQAWAVG
jgi:uncharacterized protein YuzE